MWATFVDCDAEAARRIVLADNRTNDLARARRGGRGCAPPARRYYCAMALGKEEDKG